jgi:lipopolysaccharide biosynthesis glycosyltransferase
MLAAVPDAGIYDKISEVEDKEIIKLGTKYFNAGIMLINLKLWKEENADHFIAKKISEYKKEWYNSEQSILNYAFYDRCKYIHLKYNFYTAFHFEDYVKVSRYLNVKRAFHREEYLEAKRNPAIIHFVGLPYVRPWYYKNISPYRDVYMEYYKQSPWSEEELQRMPKNPQLSYRVYDYILYVAQKHKLYRLQNLIRSIFSGKIKSMLRRLLGSRK